MKFNTKTIVAIGIGTALFFVLGRFASIPTPIPATYLSTQYGLLGMIAVLFGPVAGLLVGFIGHTLLDLSFGGAPWFSWVLASAATGLVIGLGCMKMKVNEGEFGMAGIVRFNIVQIIANVIAWGLVAPGLDILIYAEPADKVFIQGLTAGGLNIIITAILGTLLLVAYAATRTKKGSLNKQ